MAAYWIARSKINDPIEYKKYTDLVLDIVAKYQGRVLARGGKYKTMEGPDFGFPVQWMYIGDKDVLHVAHGGAKASDNCKAYLGQQSQSLSGTGVIDHVAFRCSGLAEMLGNLRWTGVEFKERQVNDQGLYQVFLFDPNGVKVELNFPIEEARAAGVTAPVSAKHFVYQHVEDDR